MTKLTCTVCNTPWVEESPVNSKKNDLEERRQYFINEKL
jgi:hypothetical protein